MLTTGDSNLVTVSVAVIGAAGTAFSAWLYTRHNEKQNTPPLPPVTHNQVHRIKEGIVMDIPTDPMDIETFHLLVKRIRQLERWRRHVVPVLRKLANLLEWTDDEIWESLENDEDDP